MRFSEIVSEETHADVDILRPLKSLTDPIYKYITGKDPNDTKTNNKPADNKPVTQSGMPLDTISVNQPFGKHGHPGVDLKAGSGTPVKAPVSGTVTQAIMTNNSCGGTIAIATRNVTHRFCHCKEINVRVGQQVRQGQVVGKTGGDPNDRGHGRSSGSHLHWEKYVQNKLVDPMSNRN